MDAERPLAARHRRLADRLVRLYPRRWRARYEPEMLALIEDSRVSRAMLVDLAFGALREWGRAIIAPPEPPENLRRERWRDVIGKWVRPALWLALCWGIAQPLRATWVGTTDSGWFYLLLVPMLPCGYRSIRVSARSNRLLLGRPGEVETTAVAPEALAAMGFGRLEYWFWLATTCVMWTFCFAQTPTASWTPKGVLNLFIDGTFFNMLHAASRQALLRRWQMTALTRAAQAEKRVSS